MILSDADMKSVAAVIAERVTVRRIAGEVAEKLGIPAEAILSRSRDREVCRARELVCFVAREHGLSYPRIAAALGRDHTTIISAVRNEVRRRSGAVMACEAK